ncbi:MAG: cell division protein ZipA [Candidatus Azotimanducaceae bacterium]|jgi:cell division protein ZipA
MGFRMDFGLRDWLFILGPIFIIGVLAHGYWRMRVNRNSLKMSLDKSFLNSRHQSQDGAAEVETLRAELPNGGARVISKPTQVSLNLDDDVPVLMEPVSPPDPLFDVDVVSDIAVPAMLESGTSSAMDGGAIPDAESEPEPDDVTPESNAESERNAALESVAKLQATAPLRAVVGCPEKYLVLYVVARNKDFRGDALRSCLNKHQMRLGEMNIFHRLNADDRSEFSLVNAIEPGTFDADTMASMTTPALSLFMRAHELTNPILTYHEMLGVAEALAKTLNGEVRDESRQPLSRQTMEHYQADLQIFVDTYFR